MKRILFLLTALLLLSACAKNKVAPIVTYHNSPVLASAYLYSLGTVQFYQEDFDSADYLFRAALERDPLSNEIRKQILRTNLFSYEQGGATADAMNGLIDTLRTEMPFDEEMLNYAYTFYSKSKDSAKLKAILEEMISQYPSAQTYLDKVFYAYTYEGKVDRKSLDAAYKLSLTDPEKLYMIAGVYAAIDRKTAIHALYKLRKLKMSNETETLLTQTLLEQHRYADVKALFMSYTYPDDAVYMANFLEELQNTSHLDIIVRLADTIIATGDRKLLKYLAATAFVLPDADLLRKIEALMPRFTPDPQLDSTIYAIILADQLCNQRGSQGPDYAAKLCSISDIDALLSYSLVHYSNVRKIPYNEIDSTFVDYIQTNMAHVTMPAPVARYLQVNVQFAFGMAPADSVLVARAECANYMIAKGFAGVSDYTYAIQEISLNGSTESKIALMREATDHYPLESSFLNDLGYTYLSEKQHVDEAKALIQRALEIEPKSVYALDSMAWYYYIMGDPQKAVQYIYFPALMEDIPSDIALHVGMIYFALGEYDAAAKYLQLTIDKGDSLEFPGKAAELLEQIHQIRSTH